MSKKLNGFDKWLIQEGIKMIVEKLKEDIVTIEESGKNALYTAGYIEGVAREIFEKLKIKDKDHEA